MSAVLAPKHDPARRCRPRELWPDADWLAWAAALAPGDVLDPGGPASRWAPITRHGVIKSYGRWLTWLDRTGQLDPASPPAGRVTPERVKGFILALQQVNAPKTVLHRIVGLAQAAGALAPDADWAWLWRIVGRLRRAARPARLKRVRLVGVDELFALGRDLMAEAERAGAWPAWRPAVAYRDGLMIALLAARPLRLKNFVAIEIGRHLTEAGRGHRLHFTRPEMKTSEPVELSFPRLLEPALDRYVSVYRPILCERDSSRADTKHDVRGARTANPLWVSSRGGAALSRNGLYDRIVTLTRVRLGRPINPHLFRDCAATSIAIEDPEHVLITAAVLAHSGLQTSEQHYNHAEALQAIRRYQEHIRAQRRER
jgi:integrase/recombinase XerD